MTKPGFEVLEHPADIGILSFGPTLKEAFAESARGLMFVILDVTSVRPSDARRIRLQAVDSEQLLVKWLSEILYLYDGERFAACEFQILQLTENWLEATVRGEPLDPNRHRVSLDVKAITYHQLSISQSQKGAEIRVFLDV